MPRPYLFSLFALLVWVLLCLPFAIFLIGYEDPQANQEHRLLADWPSIPTSWSTYLDFTKRVDAYLNDHFGGREALVRANTRLDYALFHEVGHQQIMFASDGRLIFTSHDRDHPFWAIRSACGIGVAPDSIADAANHTRDMVNYFRQFAPNVVVLLVPTVGVLYPEVLPGWLGDLCAHSTPPGKQLAALFRSGTPQLAGRFVYPAEQMRSWKGEIELLPRDNFHWDGDAPRRLAAELAVHEFGLYATGELPLLLEVKPSDVAQLFPGLKRQHTVVAYNAAADAAHTSCKGPACLPDEGDWPMKLFDISHYGVRHGPHRGRRLLMISDSFGSYAAMWYAPYFDEVLQLGINAGNLNPEDMEKMKTYAFRRYAPTDILLLYHDTAWNYQPVIWKQSLAIPTRALP